MTELLHLDFDPSSIVWIADLQSRVHKSSSPLVRKRYESWATVGLYELTLAIATRLAMVRRVEDHLKESLTRLKDEVAQSDDLDALLEGRLCYRPSDQRILFDVCAGVDSCFFEWRSLYELVGKFARTFVKEMLHRHVTEAQLVEVVNQAGVPTKWIDALRENRKLFFHQMAPWIALQISARKPLECELVVMKENLHTLDDPARFVLERELIEVSTGLRQSVVAVREWLKRQLESTEQGATGDGSAG